MLGNIREEVEIVNHFGHYCHHSIFNQETNSNQMLLFFFSFFFRICLNAASRADLVASFSFFLSSFFCFLYF